MYNFLALIHAPTLFNGNKQRDLKKHSLTRYWPMRKEAGWQWYSSIGLPSSYSRCDFQTNRCKPRPVRGLKLPVPSEPFSCNLQSKIVSQRRMKFELIWGLFTIVKTTMSKRAKCLFIWLAHFCRCIAEHCNDAKVTIAMLPIAVRYHSQNTKSLKISAGIA